MVNPNSYKLEQAPPIRTRTLTLRKALKEQHAAAYRDGATVYCVLLLNSLNSITEFLRVEKGHVVYFLHEGKQLDGKVFWLGMGKIKPIKKRCGIKANNETYWRDVSDVVRKDEHPDARPGVVPRS